MRSSKRSVPSYTSVVTCDDVRRRSQHLPHATGHALDAFCLRFVSPAGSFPFTLQRSAGSSATHVQVRISYQSRSPSDVPATEPSGMELSSSRPSYEKSLWFQVLLSTHTVSEVFEATVGNVTLPVGRCPPDPPNILGGRCPPEPRTSKEVKFNKCKSRIRQVQQMQVQNQSSSTNVSLRRIKFDKYSFTIGHLRQT